MNFTHTKSAQRVYIVTVTVYPLVAKAKSVAQPVEWAFYLMSPKLFESIYKIAKINLTLKVSRTARRGEED